jgi:hypothetical protein
MTRIESAATIWPALMLHAPQGIPNVASTRSVPRAGKK